MSFFRDTQSHYEKVNLTIKNYKSHYRLHSRVGSSVWVPGTCQGGISFAKFTPIFPVWWDLLVDFPHPDCWWLPGTQLYHQRIAGMWFLGGVLQACHWYRIEIHKVPTRCHCLFFPLHHSTSSSLTWNCLCPTLSKSFAKSITMMPVCFPFPSAPLEIWKWWYLTIGRQTLLWLNINDHLVRVINYNDSRQPCLLLVVFVTTIWQLWALAWYLTMKMNINTNFKFRVIPCQITQCPKRLWPRFWWKCIHMVPVTQIEGIQVFFNLTSYFQIYGTFKFYENVNFRVTGLFQNPHCTKYISHRII